MSAPSGKPNPKLIVISAPSGTGKTTLCTRLLREVPELMLSISTTTRAPRGQEKHGEAYFFTTPEEFRRLIDAGRFAEWADVHGNFYGTAKDFVEKAFAGGKSLLLDIDVQGAEQLRQSYPGETVRIFLKPPSMEELERRLRARGTDSEESIAKRMQGAAKEIAEMDRFDHVIVNDDLERAGFELVGVVLAAVRGKTYA